MQSDADRFRPRDGAVSEQSPPSEGQPPSFGQTAAPQRARYAQPQYAQPQYAQPQYAPPQYAPPRSAALQHPAPFGNGDAPLIHPAAAQTSSVTPYGVPVYQAPGFAFAPQPSRGLSISALVLGLCSVVFAWIFVVVPIIGIVFGFLALKREPGGKAMAVVGLVSSGLGLLWVLLFYLLPMLAFFGAMLFAATSP